MIIDILRPKLSPSEIKTWFSKTTLKIVENNNAAIIEVPNKFVANWLKDNYLNDIKKSLKSILNHTADIEFRTTQKDFPISAQINPKNKQGSFKNNLNSSMTFDNYITGGCNRFAFYSALEISNRPGRHYNPLFIFSESSMGKTHLLNAIGNHFYNKDQHLRVKYVNSKKFISDFNISLRNNYFNDFRQNYHDIDILLFDDIHHLINRYRLQEEFLSIFNHLYGDNKQIAITGDRPPNRLKDINPQLKSRLGCGLITEIKEIDSETKINIINYKFNDVNIDIPNDIISFLVKSNNDMNKLLKNIVRLKTFISLNNGNINLSSVKSIIKNRDSVEIGIKDIKSITSNYFNISITDLISNKKKKIYSYPRHLAMYLCRKYTNLSLQEIGYQFGDRDHSTVIYATKKIERSKMKDKEMRDDLTNIEKILC